LFKQEDIDLCNNYYQEESDLWGDIGLRTELYRITKPNSGYSALKDVIELKNVKDYFLVSENIDGVIEKVGLENSKVWEVNGNYQYFQCKHGEVFSSRNY